MKFKTTTQEIKSISPADLTLHTEALATPRMSEVAYEALKKDIEIKGQLDPVITYRGKIIDGRHRWLILQELEIDAINYTALPNNTTLTEIKSLVQSKETRRHETASQLAIRAYRLYKEPNSLHSSMAEAADSVGSNRKRVGDVKKIVEMYGRSDIIQLLFDGEQFNTGTAHIPFWTDSLPTIIRWLSENGTVTGAKPKTATIEPRKELTADEQMLVNSYVTALKKESGLVTEHVISVLYGMSKEQTL